MDTTKFLTGTVVGTIVGFGVGFLIFGVALSSYMEQNIANPESMDFLWLILGHAVFAALLTYIFMRWAGIKTAMGGLKAAAVITLLASLGTNWIWLGSSGLFPGGVTAAIVDALGATVVWSIGGAAIGWVLGRGE